MKKLAVSTIISVLLLSDISPMLNAAADSGNLSSSFDSYAWGHSNGQHFSSCTFRHSRALAGISVSGVGASSTVTANVAQTARAALTGNAATSHIHSMHEA